MSAPLNILGIYREEIYSNRAVAADKAILDEVLSEFTRKSGGKIDVTKIRPEDKALKVLDFDWDLVFSMAQDSQILAHLDILETRGTLVVNSGRSIRNCYRNKLSELLGHEDFSYPRSLTLDVGECLRNEKEIVTPFDSQSGFWIKRGDFHALVDEDVIHVDNQNSLFSSLLEFQSRGVEKVILQENIQGELFKFYGVRDHFFSLRYMGKTTHDRYSFIAGNPDVNFDRDLLETRAHQAARVLELDFFGGDCIINEKGMIHFIDFNDWPSFRTCRKIAASSMASYTLSKIKGEVLIAQNNL